MKSHQEIPHETEVVSCPGLIGIAPKYYETEAASCPGLTEITPKDYRLTEITKSLRDRSGQLSAVSCPGLIEIAPGANKTGLAVKICFRCQTELTPGNYEIRVTVSST